MQDGGSHIRTAAARDGVISANLTSVLADVSQESKDAVAGLNFESHGRAENETAGGKRSRVSVSDPLTETGRIECDRSGDSKTAVRTGVGALSDVTCQVEAPP